MPHKVMTSILILVLTVVAVACFPLAIVLAVIWALVLVKAHRDRAARIAWHKAHYGF